MRQLIPFLFLSAIGCNESTFHKPGTAEAGLSPGEVYGRVCSADGRTWRSDALAYVNLFDEENRLYETVLAYTDRDGYFLLSDLPPEQYHHVYVQYGGDTLLDTEVWVGDGERIELPEPDCFNPADLDVAVVLGDYDDFELVLDNMGFANYQLVDGLSITDLQDFLLDAESMSQYDIIFFNGGHEEQGVIYGDSDGGVSTQIMTNIRDYVSAGGSVYASDWAYDDVEIGWPDRIDFVGNDDEPDAAQLGEYSYLTAAVSDSAMADWLGDNYIDIEYDLPVWPPIENVSTSVSVHLTGTVEYRSGTSTYTLSSVPIMVSFTSGEGKVAFSTFRVAKNASTDMLLVLQYMMYSL